MKKGAVRYVMRFTMNLIFYCAAIVGIGYTYIHCYNFTYLAFSNPVCVQGDTTYRTVEILEGESSKDVMLDLQSKGLVENAYATLIRLKCSKYEGMLKSGSYKLQASMSMDDILAILAQDNEADIVKKQQEIWKQEEEAQ